MNNYAAVAIWQQVSAQRRQDVAHVGSGRGHIFRILWHSELPDESVR